MPLLTQQNHPKEVASVDQGALIKAESSDNHPRSEMPMVLARCGSQIQPTAEESLLEPCLSSSLPTNSHCDIPERSSSRLRATTATRNSSADQVQEVTSLFRDMNVNGPPSPQNCSSVGKINQANPSNRQNKVIQAAKQDMTKVEAKGPSESRVTSPDGELVDVDIDECEATVSSDDEFEIIDEVAGSEPNEARKKWYKGWMR